MEAVVTPEPCLIIEVKPETLHQHWPFIRRGLEEIIKNVRPDFIPEDIYSAIRKGEVNCAIAQRGGKSLCFAVYYKETRPFSGKTHLFVWTVWNLPPKERTEADNVPEAFMLGWRYLKLVAKTVFGSDAVWWITTPSRARAMERKYGWKARFTTMETLL